MYAVTIVSKSEENNLEVAFEEINSNDNLAYSLHIPEQILAGKVCVTPLRDKTYQEMHQGSLFCHPQLHEDRMSNSKLKFVHALE